MYYLNAPSGGGKTYYLIEIVAKIVGSGENVIFCQPTTELIDRTVDDMRRRYPYLHIEVFHGGISSSPVADIIRYIYNLYHEPHVLFITHAALELLPMGFKRENWHLIIDEILMVTKAFEKNLSANHGLITPYLVTNRPDGEYYRVAAKDNKSLTGLADNPDGDAVIEIFEELAYTVLSDHWTSFTPAAGYDALVSGTGSGRKLTVLSLLQPSLVQGFKGVTIAGASFTDSLLYKYWAKHGVRFVELSELKLKYDRHENGSELDIYYFIDQHWSKSLARKKEGEILKAMEKNILNEVGTSKFLFAQNKGCHLFKNVETRFALPNAPHGLNTYQRYLNVVYLSARNLIPAHGKFLERMMGIKWDDIHTAIQHQVAYQTIMRGALRDQDNHEPKRVFVPDKATAEWLQMLFPGSRVTKLEIGIDEETICGRRGRPKIYNSDAARKRASRRKQKIDELDNLSKPLMFEENDPTIFRLRESACASIQNVSHDIPIKTNSIFATYFRGSVFSAREV